MSRLAKRKEEHEGNTQESSSKDKIQKRQEHVFSSGSNNTSTAAAKRALSSSLTHAFFSGAIKDGTTEKSRKEDKNMARLKAMMKGKRAAPARGGGGGGSSGRVLTPLDLALRDSVRKEVERRIEKLHKEGKTFEDGAAYKDNPINAEHARMIIDGKVCSGLDAFRMRVLLS